MNHGIPYGRNCPHYGKEVCRIKHIIGHYIREDNGKSIKENNLKKQHSFPVGSLVEFKDSGIRLLVCKHMRDCDGSLLYCLTWDDDWTEEKQNENPYISYMTCGYPEDYLNLIKKAPNAYRN